MAGAILFLATFLATVMADNVLALPDVWCLCLCSLLGKI